MSLYDRLARVEEPRIATHDFAAAVGERLRTKIARSDLITMFNVQLAEEADLDAILVRAAVLGSNELHETLLLSGTGVTGYNTGAGLKSKLGIL